MRPYEALKEPYKSLRGSYKAFKESYKALRGQFDECSAIYANHSHLHRSIVGGCNGPEIPLEEGRSGEAESQLRLVSSRISQLQKEKSTRSVHDPKLVLKAIHETVVLGQCFYEVSDSVHTASALALII